MPSGHHPRQKLLFIDEARSIYFKPIPLLLFVIHIHYGGKSIISHTAWHTGEPTRGITNAVGAAGRRTIGAVGICRVAAHRNTRNRPHQ